MWGVCLTVLFAALGCRSVGCCLFHLEDRFCRGVSVPVPVFVPPPPLDCTSTPPAWSRGSFGGVCVVLFALFSPRVDSSTESSRRRVQGYCYRFRSGGSLLVPAPTVFLRVRVSCAPRDVVPVQRWSPVAHPSADLVFGLLFRQRHGRHRHPPHYTLSSFPSLRLIR